MIKRIVTHHMPHVDEIVALWLLRKFGEKIFPGVANATVEYIDPGRALPDGRSADEWEDEGALLLGVGGGRFDEHPAAGEERKDGECAASLVAHALGVADMLELGKILKYTINNDTKGSSAPLDIVDMTKAMFAVLSHEEVLAWAYIGLDAKYAQQVEFFKAGEDFERTGKRYTIEQKKYRPLRVVSIQSDNPYAAAYVRLVEDPDLVVVGRSGNGYLGVLARQAMKLDLRGLAARIRFMECEKAKNPLPDPIEKLIQEGTLTEIPEWYLQNGCWILNGSLRTKSETTPKTRLSVDEVVGIVMYEFGVHA